MDAQRLNIGLPKVSCDMQSSPLPSVEEYNTWVEGRITGKRGHNHVTGRQARRIAAMRRNARPHQEIADAVGLSLTTADKIYKELPEALK